MKVYIVMQTIMDPADLNILSTVVYKVFQDAHQAQDCVRGGAPMDEKSNLLFYDVVERELESPSEDTKTIVLLSASLLVEYGFELVAAEDSLFEGYEMPYYAKEAVVLFFNEGRWNEGSFYVGYGEHRFGKYTAVAFRWVHTEKALLEVYKAVTGGELLKKLDNQKEVS